MIILFKKGTSHVINNITCEMQIINEFGFEGLLAENGGEWHFSPEDTIEAVPKKKSKVPIPGPGTTTEDMKKSRENK